MSLKCPSCKKRISPFAIENNDFACPSCKTTLRSNTSTWAYVGFRLFAGAIALSFAQALTSKNILQWLSFILIVGVIAYAIIQSCTSLKLASNENEL